MIEPKRKLNTAQFRLRDYILNLSKENKVAYPENIRSLFPEYDVKDYRRKITYDINFINKYGLFDKLIISFHDGGYKIPTQKEYEDYSKSRWAEINKMAKLQAHMDKKAQLDGQGKIGLEPYGSATYEAFVKGVNGDGEQSINSFTS